MPIHDVVRQRLQPLTSAVTSNRILLYGVFSAFALLGTIANACRSYSNFYSVAIYLSRSSRSVLVLANFGFLVALACGRIMQQLFFGPLQPREIERLYDQTWIFVTESLLAFTIFRDDFDIPFVLMFGLLLFVKCFHWLLADRVETMDQTTYPGPPFTFHVRMNLLFGLLWTLDIVMFAIAVENTLNNGIGGMVLFASEYAILLASALNSMARYVLSVIDYRRARARGGENAPPMENKSMYIFYIELVTDFLKLTTYLTFFMLILTFYGLPLNIIRDVYLTARSFITRLRALIRYHNATRDMDRRYPNATEAELSDMSDRTCIICREEMVPRNPQPQAGDAAAEAQAPIQDGPNMTPKKLPCGHIFHFQCLRSWLERQQSCPTCRRTVLETDAANQPQGQGRAEGGRPAPAQPGAALPGQQPGQQRANPMGWLGRFLGLPAQQPAVQGQHIHGQFAPAGNLPQHPAPNFAWGGGQPAPPAYFYPGQYVAQAQQPQQLQEPPVFQGFYGPGGVWQPWGMDPQWFARQPQQRGEIPTRPSSPQSSVFDSNSQNSARSVHAETSAAPVQTQETSTDPAQSPRDAAAQAALRRMGPSRSGMGPNSDSTASTSSSTDTTSSLASTVPFANSETSSSQSSARPAIPSLIPLYDFSTQGGRPPAFNHSARQFFRPEQPQSQPASSSSYASTQSRSTQPPPARYRTSGTSAARTPLTQLPQTLTDEQLARLDRLTRDAIDERLRVLEGVSGAVYRCIEELTRVRSVLPASSGVSSTHGQEPERPATQTSAETRSAPVAGTSSSTQDDPARNVGESGALSAQSAPEDVNTHDVPVSDG